MADNTFIIRTYEEAPDLAGASSAVRGEQPDVSAAVDPDEDITTTLHGSKAITGKVVWSANNAVRHANADEAKHREETESNKLERDLIRMAEWDAARVNIGGVEMTNAEAHEARVRILEQREKYIARSISRGDITEKEGKALMDGIKRDDDLAEKERRGTITAEERAEREQWRTSHLGTVAGDMIAGNVTEHRAEATGPAVKSENLFPSAPPLASAFERAHAGSATEAQPIRPATPVPELRNSGLDF